MSYSYKVYGLTFESEIEFPELNECDFDKPDVWINIGGVPDNIPNPIGSGVLYQASSKDFIFCLDPIAKYRVQNGNKITIEPYKNAVESDVRLFLFGSSIGALFYQRQMLALHGSAVIYNSKSVIFTGPSAAGKSTLAAGFHKLNYSVLTDDISVIDLSSEKNISVYPGIPQLKLWGDSLEELHLKEKIVRIRPNMEKYLIQITNSVHLDSVPLHKVVLLATKQSKGFTYQEIFGGDKIKVLSDNTYRNQFIEKMQGEEMHFRNIIILAKTVNVYRVERPMHPFSVNELVNYISNEILFK